MDGFFFQFYSLLAKEGTKHVESKQKLTSYHNLCSSNKDQSKAFSIVVPITPAKVNVQFVQGKI